MKEQKKDKKKNHPEEENKGAAPQEQSPEIKTQTEEKESAPADSDVNEPDDLKKKLADMNDRYVRLSAEFDNYRKRTLKEKTDLIKTGGEDVIVNLLHVVDDFERAMLAMDKTEEIQPVRDGVKLIYTKFIEYLKTRGVKEIDSMNVEFNTDLHEAITKIPVPDEKLKGKVVDVVQKGYFMHDKVIRFVKVVVGE